MARTTFNSQGGSSASRPLLVVALCVAALVAAALLFAGSSVVARQKAAVLREEIRAGRLLVSHLSGSAVFPLLGDDAFTLGNLVRLPPGGRNILFIDITDAGDVIRAHSDPSRVGKLFRLPPSAANQGTVDGVTQYSYPLPAAGGAVLLAGPLVIRGKVVGAVHVAFSAAALDREAEGAAAGVRRYLLGVGALAAAAIAGMMVLFALGFSASRVSANRREVGRARNEPAYRVMAIRDESFSDDAPSSGEGTFPARSVLRKALSIVGFPPETPRDDEKQETPQAPRIARNQATVLVSNVREFRAFADSCRPEEILSGLNSYFDIAKRVVAAHGGRVTQFSGDTVVAVFGGATFLPDHTRRAVRAAHAVQMELRKAVEGMPQAFPRRVAIGISSGVVLSCEVGASCGTDPVMIGDSFKSADALAMLAGPGEIVIDREVYQYLGHAVSVDPLPPREILDRTGSWENFRLQADGKRRA